MDDSRPSNGKLVTGEDLRAMDAVLAGKPVNPEQKPSIGCGHLETNLVIMVSALRKPSSITPDR